eukprot:CAMPEP_0113944856 /NCGR_PEP_ID=MMETSP1339-20121228/37270_1 /TAXON_ID=94617 /ORGANISM="Fibrocapsa japonica" /LENGTH=78 /DNA_ID=CAMNT_0000950193 /DNA_START=15 /DNA_END=251 /DNA_ORIENTATION=+ /assembly_acc=CAM_ASM_000762
MADYGAMEGLAASQILDRSDPSLLTWKEVKSGWGGCANFMYSHGLKPFNDEDCEQARAMSRAFKSDHNEESKESSQTT